MCCWTRWLFSRRRPASRSTPLSSTFLSLGAGGVLYREAGTETRVQIQQVDPACDPAVQPCELLTNFGSTRFNGGLNLAANLLGKPGKMDVQGHMVQDLFNEGRLAEISDYCRCDVLDTYFVFLRTAVILGQLPLEKEQELVEQGRVWLEQRAATVPAYAQYLEQWGTWANPWPAPTEAVTTGEAT